MKWYEQRFVNRRDWVLDHLEFLGLSEKELIIVLMIDFMSEHRIPISIDALAQKAGMDPKDVDETISLLCAKKYLDIRASGKRVSFRLDGLYDTDVAKEAGIIDRPVFDLFESELKRPLTQKDMERISEWNRIYEKRMIILALREASMYQKVSMPYIDTILREWTKKNYTADMIEQGKVRYEGSDRSGRTG
ncbi:MAG: DnaD domain protein [Solobacterium sp.]|nr:DnaD domain protein [Solobacterium sp.]